MTQQELVEDIRARHFAAKIREKVEQLSMSLLSEEETINLAIQVAFKQGYAYAKDEEKASL